MKIVYNASCKDRNAGQNVKKMWVVASTRSLSVRQRRHQVVQVLLHPVPALAAQTSCQWSLGRGTKPAIVLHLRPLTRLVPTHKCRRAYQNWMSLYPPQCTSKRDMFSSALMLGVEKAAAGTTSWKGFFRMPPVASQPSRISEQHHHEIASRRSVLQSASVLSNADTSLQGQNLVPDSVFLLAPGLSLHGSRRDNLQVKPKET